MKTSPILVTGAHRTGTTWVGKMLAACGEAGYISEPLNILHRPGVMRTRVDRWYPYICKENQAEYLPALQETLNFRYHTLAELKSLRSRKDLLRMGRDWWSFFQGRLRRQRPLIKDPFALFSVPWFIQQLNCQVIITVRHPAAFASSLKRLNWPFDFNNLLSQPLLMRDWLGPFKAEMETASDVLYRSSDALYRSVDQARPAHDVLDRAEFARRQSQTAGNQDIIGQASLLWRIIYSAVLRLSPTMPLHCTVVRHEDLSIDPIEGFQNLYQTLGLNFNDRAQETILNSSSSENPKEAPHKRDVLDRSTIYTTRIDSRSNLHNWKKRLSAEEIIRVRELTEDVAAQYYPDLAWE